MSVNTARQEALVRASDSVADSHCRLFPAALLCSVFTHLTLFTAVFLTFIYVFNCQLTQRHRFVAAQTALNLPNLTVPVRPLLRDESRCRCS